MSISPAIFRALRVDEVVVATQRANALRQLCGALPAALESGCILAEGETA
ncbi:hypothetical protein BH09MYX1_BH09MYX1_46760 [soil metagenome]